MDRCPNCGYCPHCGRSNQQTYPVVVPYVPPPYIGWDTTSEIAEPFTIKFIASTDTL